MEYQEWRILKLEGPTKDEKSLERLKSNITNFRTKITFYRILIAKVNLTKHCFFPLKLRHLIRKTSSNKNYEVKRLVL